MTSQKETKETKFSSTMAGGKSFRIILLYVLPALIVLTALVVPFRMGRKGYWLSIPGNPLPDQASITKIEYSVAYLEAGKLHTMEGVISPNDQAELITLFDWSRYDGSHVEKRGNGGSLNIETKAGYSYKLFFCQTLDDSAEPLLVRLGESKYRCAERAKFLEFFRRMDE